MVSLPIGSLIGISMQYTHSPSEIRIISAEIVGRLSLPLFMFSSALVGMMSDVVPSISLWLIGWMGALLIQYAMYRIFIASKGS